MTKTKRAFKLPSKQVMFNRAWRHFIEGRGKKSADQEYSTSCFYRADQTAKCKVRCAIGLFIPDGIYEPKIEGFGAAQALKDLGCTLFDSSFVEDFQAQLHDELDTTKRGSLRLAEAREVYKDFAKHHGLKVPTPRG